MPKGKRSDRAMTVVLVVHEGLPDALVLAQSLTGLGYGIHLAAPGSRQIARGAAALFPDVILAAMAPSHVTSVLQAVKRIRKRLDKPLVYLVAGPYESILERLERTRPQGLVSQPASPRQLDLAIRHALASHRRVSSRTNLEDLQQARSDLEQTIEDLHDQTHLLETVFESMTEGLFVSTADGSLMWANARAQELLGYGTLRENPSAWPRIYGFREPRNGRLLSLQDLPMLRVLRGESFDDAELFLKNDRRPHGLTLRVTGRPLKDETGKVHAGVVIFYDMTAQKVAESRLRETVDQLETQTRLMQTVFNNMEEGVLVADTDGNFLLTNPRREQIVGSKLIASEPAEWPATFGAFYVDQKTPVPTEALPLVRAMRGEATEDIELFIRNERRPRGAYVRVRGRPLIDGNGSLSGGVAIFSDVTKYKEAETQLEQTIRDLKIQAELLEATFDGISEGLVIADTEGKVLNANPAARQLAGLDDMPPGEANLIRKWGTYYYPDRETLIPAAELPLNRAVFLREPVSDMDVFVRSDQRPDGFFLRVSARPLLHPSGYVRGGVVIFRDVTDQVLAEEALTRAFAQGRLEIIDTILHNIGNAVSSVTVGIDTLHGILQNNPITKYLRILAEAARDHEHDWAGYVANDPQGRKIHGYIKVLDQSFERQSAQMARTASRVRDRAHHIAEIIRTQKVLDRPHMSRKDIPLEQAIAAAARVMSETLDKRGIRLTIDAREAPREIRTQESQFHQMIVNLIKNAVEAIDDLTARGGMKEAPAVSIRAYPEGDFLCLDVSDNGAGIEPSDIRLVFAAGYTTKKHGSGLGLHASANYVAGSGGQIRALSAGPGRGATLQVKLRLAAVTPPVHARN